MKTEYLYTSIYEKSMVYGLNLEKNVTNEINKIYTIFANGGTFAAISDDFERYINK